jgi:hypothetical protein
MKKTIFFLIFIIFAGCAQKNAPNPEAPAILNKITNAVPSEAAPANAAPKKATNAISVAEVEPAPSKKIDYDAINKSILKDVSKKILDKASKKD